MADAVNMVVVDGIRYRPEDAPKRTQDETEPKARTSAKNKARTASNTKG